MGATARILVLRWRPVNGSVGGSGRPHRQTNLIVRREETAPLRSQPNTAKVLAPRR